MWPTGHDIKLDESTETPTSYVTPVPKVSSDLRSHIGCVSHQGFLSTPVSLSFYDNQASHSRDTLTLKIQGKK